MESLYVVTLCYDRFKEKNPEKCGTLTNKIIAVLKDLEKAVSERNYVTVTSLQQDFINAYNQ